MIGKWFEFGYGYDVGGFWFGDLVLVKWDNRERDRKEGNREGEGMTVEEVRDLDWGHPGWRWKI